MVTGLLIMMPSAVVTAEQACADHNASCDSFTGPSESEHFEKLVAQVYPNRVYSSVERENIAQAYLMLAARESNTPEQEELYCQKALEYGAASAYMGLYFIHAGTNPEKAFGYLHQYVLTDPRDVLPYAILSEVALHRKNYRAAVEYLLKAKKVARGRSTNLDWLLFQASYLLGDYAVAASMLDSAITRGQYVNELRTLVIDPRFAGLAKRPEFEKYELMLKGTSAKTTE
jgi:tetratricopeptide (TPR) repeat protein